MRRGKKIWMTALALLCMTGLSAQDMLSFEEAVRIVLENNLNVRIAMNRQQMAEKSATRANAGFYPNIDIAAGQNNSIVDARQVFVDGRILDRDNARTHSINGGAMLNWTLFDGMNMFITYNRLQELNELTKIELKERSEQLVLETGLLYYNIVVQKQLLAATRENMDIVRQRQEMVKNRYDLGSASGSDLLQAQLDLNEQRSQYLSQQAQTEVLKVQLNELLARDPYTDFDVQDSIPVERDIPSRLKKESNSSLLLARKNVEISRLEHRSRMAAFAPGFDLNLGYNYFRSRSEAGFIASNRTLGFSYGVTVYWRIPGGFNYNRQSQVSRLIMVNSEVNRQLAEMQVSARYARTFRNYELALEVLRLEEENIQLARRHINISLERYRLGAMTALEMREAERTFTLSQTRYVNALYRAKSAAMEIRMLNGEIITVDK